MSEIDLDHANAIKKLGELAERIDFAMMATALDERPIHIVPMSTKKVDDKGCIWFLSSKESNHNRNLEKSNEVHLVYSDKGAMEFLNVFGTATITTDPTILKELYGKGDNAWFDGVNDPSLTAICVSPVDAFYWDPKDNKLLTLLKMGVAAVTGKEPELMDYGRLNI